MRIAVLPSPSHVTPRGFVGPNPSSLIAQVGARAASIKLLHALIEAHVLGAEGLHGDDTTVSIPRKSKTDIGRRPALEMTCHSAMPSQLAALYYASATDCKSILGAFQALCLHSSGGCLRAMTRCSRWSAIQALYWSRARRKPFVIAWHRYQRQGRKKRQADLAGGARSRAPY